MDRRLIWTERASADLQEIVRYLAERRPEAARRVSDEIRNHARLPLQQPEVGAFVPELRPSGWRRLIIRRWKIVYRVDESRIIIGRIWPAAMGDVSLQRPL